MNDPMPGDPNCGRVMNTHVIEVGDPQRDPNHAHCSCGEWGMRGGRAELMRDAYQHLSDCWAAMIVNESSA